MLCNGQGREHLFHKQYFNNSKLECTSNPLFEGLRFAISEPFRNTPVLKQENWNNKNKKKHSFSYILDIREWVEGQAAKRQLNNKNNIYKILFKLKIVLGSLDHEQTSP